MTHYYTSSNTSGTGCIAADFLIISSRLCLGLPIGLFPSGFPIKTSYTFLTSIYGLILAWENKYTTISKVIVPYILILNVLGDRKAKDFELNGTSVPWI
jgi:hypothetical protein